MHTRHASAAYLRHPKAFWAVKASLVIVALAFGFITRASAACPTLPEPNGSVSYTVSIPSAANYTVWSRMNAPNANDNSYYLEIDDTTCGVMIGDTVLPTNTWTWVNYHGGNTSSKVTVNLSAGNHTVRMVGRETGVKLDRLVFTADASCVPTGLGDNCASPPADTTPPTVSVTAPVASQTVSGNITLTANASDNQGVGRVEFFVDNQMVGQDSSTPYATSWNTSSVANGAHSITAKAYDIDNNFATSTAVNVTVSNQAPVPTFRPEDINQDTKVNILDLSILASKYGQQGANLGRADMNGDGRVNVLDLSMLASKYGT